MAQIMHLAIQKQLEKGVPALVGAFFGWKMHFPELVGVFADEKWANHYWKMLFSVGKSTFHNWFAFFSVGKCTFQHWLAFFPAEISMPFFYFHRYLSHGFLAIYVIKQSKK